MLILAWWAGAAPSSLNRGATPEREPSTSSLWHSMIFTETSVKEAARIYIEKGWEVVPLLPGEKSPGDKDWNKIVFRAEDFEPKDNIGIRSTKGLIDVDCDAQEVVLLAPNFLPETGAIYGRNGSPRHWLFYSSVDKTLVFTDLCKKDKKGEKATLIEIRVNHQSMAPPSNHPEGGIIQWLDDTIGEPLKIEAEKITRAVRLLASCAMVARYYNPPGARHDWGMALSGTLKQLGVTESEMIHLFQSAADFVGDGEVKDRIGTVRSTYNRAEDEPTRAGASLKELMLNGEQFAASLYKIWGKSSTNFLLDQKGERILANSQENIKKAVDKLGIGLTFNAFSQIAIVKYNGYVGPLEDRVRNRIWLDIDSKFHFRPAPDFFDVVIKDLADKNQIHPVRDYLAKLTWDKEPRIDTWLIRGAKAADTEYTRRISAMVLIAAVRRVRKPGCKFDELLVLESSQGQFKSSMLRALCPDPDWFSDDLPLNVDSKQIIERTAGKWIIEAQELSGMRKSQREHLKSMLSRQVDGPVRMAYARLPVSQPRQFIVIGTTNDHHYLQDPTGNRRFWPMRVDRFDLDLVIRERDQMWAEAAFREAEGESIRLPQSLWAHAGVQQERRRNEDPWEEIIQRNFCQEEIVRLTPADIWEALGIAIERRSDQYQQRIASIMQRFGFRSMTIKGKDGKNVRGWGKGNKPGTKSLFRPGDEEPEPEKQDEDENPEITTIH
jgi:predicted P-loop ATPase